MNISVWHEHFLVLPHWLRCLYAGGYAGLAAFCKGHAVSGYLRLMPLPPIPACSFSNFCIHYVAKKSTPLLIVYNGINTKILRGLSAFLHEGHGLLQVTVYSCLHERQLLVVPTVIMRWEMLRQAGLRACLSRMI